MINKILKWYLTIFLIIVPFHFTIFNFINSFNGRIASIFNKLDEITVILLFPVAILKLYNIKNIPFRFYLILLFSIIIVCFVGLGSGIINDNPLKITLLGTFDYVKHFFIIFIYAAFFKDFKEFNNIFKVLLISTVFIGLIAVFEETWVMYSKYIMEQSISGSGWRLGIYRAKSLLSHYNLLGLYSLFILTVYLYIWERVRLSITLPILAGIFCSVSRIAYSGLALLSILQIIKKRKLFILILIPILIGLFFMSSLDDLNFYKLIKASVDVKYTTSMTENVISYREYARSKAFDVWHDHPLWGVGPGYFGGPTALKYMSPFYEEYNFSLILRWFRSLDQLWPQVLAEMGIVGVAAFGGLFISILSILFYCKKKTENEIMRLFTALSVFAIIFFIYTFSGNLNNISILYSYCAFIGIGLGSLRLSKEY